MKKLESSTGLGAELVPESYSSALDSALRWSIPPATSTFPLASNVAVWPVRTVLRLAVAAHVSVVESNNSALLRARGGPQLGRQGAGGKPRFQSTPPATKTFPLGSSVAVWLSRAAIRSPV